MARKPRKKQMGNTVGCTGKGKRWKGNVREESREGKMGTVLELSLEVRWPLWESVFSYMKSVRLTSLGTMAAKFRVVLVPLGTIFPRCSPKSWRVFLNLSSTMTRGASVYRSSRKAYEYRLGLYETRDTYWGKFSSISDSLKWVIGILINWHISTRVS